MFRSKSNTPLKRYPMAFNNCVNDYAFTALLGSGSPGSSPSRYESKHALDRVELPVTIINSAKKIKKDLNFDENQNSDRKSASLQKSMGDSLVRKNVAESVFVATMTDLKKNPNAFARKKFNSGEIAKGKSTVLETEKLCDDLATKKSNSDENAKEASIVLEVKEKQDDSASKKFNSFENPQEKPMVLEMEEKPDTLAMSKPNSGESAREKSSVFKTAKKSNDFALKKSNSDDKLDQKAMVLEDEKKSPALVIMKYNSGENAREKSTVLDKKSGVESDMNAPAELSMKANSYRKASTALEKEKNLDELALIKSNLDEELREKSTVLKKKSGMEFDDEKANKNSTILEKPEMELYEKTLTELALNANSYKNTLEKSGMELDKKTTAELVIKASLDEKPQEKSTVLDKSGMELDEKAPAELAIKATSVEETLEKSTVLYKSGDDLDDKNPAAIDLTDDSDESLVTTSNVNEKIEEKPAVFKKSENPAELAVVAAVAASSSFSSSQTDSVKDPFDFVMQVEEKPVLLETKKPRVVQSKSNFASVKPAKNSKKKCRRNESETETEDTADELEELSVDGTFKQAAKRKPLNSEYAQVIPIAHRRSRRSFSKLVNYSYGDYLADNVIPNFDDFEVEFLSTKTTREALPPHLRPTPKVMALPQVPLTHGYGLGSSTTPSAIQQKIIQTDRGEEIDLTNSDEENVDDVDVTAAAAAAAVTADDDDVIIITPKPTSSSGSTDLGPGAFLWVRGQVVDTIGFGVGSVLENCRSNDTMVTIALHGDPNYCGAKQFSLAYVTPDRLRDCSKIPWFQYGEHYLTRQDVARMWPGMYLNDSIVDLFLARFVDQSLNKDMRDRIHLMPSHFYAKLANKQYDDVKTWTQRVNVFEKDFLIVPINGHTHWSLAIVCFSSRGGAAAAGVVGMPAVEVLGNCDEDQDLITSQSPRLYEAKNEEDADTDKSKRRKRTPPAMYNLAESSKKRKFYNEELQPPPPRTIILKMDSTKGHHTQDVSKPLRTWLRDEWSRRSAGTVNAETVLSITAESVPVVVPLVPLQENGVDCGVFLITYAERFLTSVAPTFTATQEDIKTQCKQWFGKKWFTQKDVFDKRIEMIRCVMQQQQQ